MLGCEFDSNKMMNPAHLGDEERNEKCEGKETTTTHAVARVTNKKVNRVKG